MENLLDGMADPMVMDVKLGVVTHTPDSPPDKRRAQAAKALASTTHSLGVRLVGARISSVQNQMAAALYYDVGGRRKTVFVFDRNLMGHDGSPPGPPVVISSSHGYTVTLTERQGVAYAIASDLPPQETALVAQGVEVR
jgi:hypothetical protein